MSTSILQRYDTWRSKTGDFPGQLATTPFFGRARCCVTGTPIWRPTEYERALRPSADGPALIMLGDSTKPTPACPSSLGAISQHRLRPAHLVETKHTWRDVL